MTGVMGGADPCTGPNATHKLTWGFSETSGYPPLEVLLDDVRDRISDYGSDVLTNLDTRVSISSRTRIIATEREKLAPTPRPIKVKKSGKITKSTKLTRFSFGP